MDPLAPLRALRRQYKRLFVWLFVVAFFAVVVGMVWAGTPYHGSEASVTAVSENPAITVERSHGNYVLRPADTTSTVGLVFYPGGRVHPDAYLASLAPLVEEANVTVVVVNMPLNLAVLKPGAAGRVASRYPGIEEWYVGGHSLGGVMACRYARNNPGAVSGVVLFASYCDKDISDRGLTALSVTGEADAVLDWGDYRQNLDHLPATARVVALPGVNHSQFGAYRGQAGGEPSGTSYAVAHRRLANVTVAWFQSRTGESPHETWVVGRLQAVKNGTATVETRTGTVSLGTDHGILFVLGNDGSWQSTQWSVIGTGKQVCVAAHRHADGALNVVKAFYGQGCGSVLPGRKTAS